MAEISDTRRHQAWTSGKKAAREGKPSTACRWQPGTIYHDDWHDAWNEATRSQSEGQVQ